MQYIDKSYGVTTGMGVCAFFASLFEANELIQSDKRKMTDVDILRRAKKEFPGRKSGIFTGSVTVNDYRGKYNRGIFTRGIPPEKMSFRYDHLGRRVEGKHGIHALLPEEIVQLQRHHASMRTKIVKKRKFGGS